MSVIVEFTVPTAEFRFGSTLETADGMAIELEAIVPTSDATLPYFWATGGEFASFERNLRSDPAVRRVDRLDRIGDTALYRVDWVHDVDGLIDALAGTEAVVLEAATEADGWYFRVRFLDHDLLGRFYNFCTDHGIGLHVERVYTLTESSRAGLSFDLTPSQREALLLAVDRGYFQVPRGTTLSAVGEELGVSQQAASKLVRRGADAVLRAALFGTRGRR